LIHKRDGTEGDGAKGHGPDTTWGGRVVCMEFRDLVWCIADVPCIFPGVAFCSVAFPFDQVLEASAVHPTVQDSFHYVLLFPIDKFQQRGQRGWVSASASNWVGQGTRQFHNVEYRV